MKAIAAAVVVCLLAGCAPQRKFPIFDRTQCRAGVDRCLERLQDDQ